MKIDSKLLEQIILEVVSRLTAKPRLLLVHDGNRKPENIESLVLELQDYWQVDVFNTNESNQEPTEFVHLAFLDANQDLLVRGALGLIDTPTSRLLSKALLEGLPVLLEPAKDIRWLIQTKDEPPIPERAKRYRTHLYNYKHILATFGAWFGMISSWHPSELRYDHKLITERDIQQMDASEVRVSTSTIITALAHDAARKKGIQIRTDHER